EGERRDERDATAGLLRRDDRLRAPLAAPLRALRDARRGARGAPASASTEALADARADRDGEDPRELRHLARAGAASLAQEHEQGEELRAERGERGPRLRDERRHGGARLLAELPRVGVERARVRSDALREPRRDVGR